MSECYKCEGWGTTQETRTKMQIREKKMVTTVQGSGCPACLGTGQTITPDKLWDLCERSGLTPLEQLKRLKAG